MSHNESNNPSERPVNPSQRQGSANPSVALDYLSLAVSILRNHIQGQASGGETPTRNDLATPGARTYAATPLGQPFLALQATPGTSTPQQGTVLAELR